jgi:hypothetical protein
MTTLNPADKSANITLSNGDLTARWNGSAGSVRSTLSKPSGKLYFEATHNAPFGPVCGIGLVNAAYAIAGFTNTANTIYSRVDALTIQGNATSLGSTNGGLNNGQTGSFAVDLTNALYWGRSVGGNWNNNVANNPATGVGGISFSYLTGPFFVFAGAAAGTAGEQSTLNFGGSAFTYAIPAGFQAWDAVAAVSQARVMVLA